jgi:hypothetical protein
MIRFLKDYSHEVKQKGKCTATGHSGDASADEIIRI